LLEVIAENLVQLDEALAVLLEPVGEAAVEIGAGRLGECVVGGVADQEMAKLVRVLAGEQGPVGPDKAAPHERRQPRRHLRLLGRERLDAAAMEELTLHCSSLEHPPLWLVELVEPRREQRLDRRRNGDVTVWSLAEQGDHLLDEEWIALRGLADPRPHPRVQ
jgi:hypothetical protein